MALATRCPNCQAMFRVVSDQLKLRGGLVRCGACRHVFDAIGSLSYIEESALAAAPAPEPTPPTAPQNAVPASPDAGRAAVSAPPAAADMPAAPSPRARPRLPEAAAALTHLPLAPAVTRSPAPTPGPAPRPAAPPPRDEAAPTPVDPLAVPTLFAPNVSIEDAAGEARLGEATAEPVERPAADAAAVHGDDMRGAPSHDARDSERDDEQDDAAGRPTATQTERAPASAAFLQQRRPSRGFSIVYGGGSLLLAGALVLQAAVLFRGELLMRWPELRPRLVTLCEFYGCSVGWPTRAEMLAVLGTELQAVPGTDILELTAVVRNRAPFRVALPAVEVTLTDTGNRTLARKVFTPADYLASSGESSNRISEGLGPGSDYVVRITFEARGLNAAGFVVYPFYL